MHLKFETMENSKRLSEESQVHFEKKVKESGRLRKYLKHLDECKNDHVSAK